MAVRDGKYFIKSKIKELGLNKNTTSKYSPSSKGSRAEILTSGQVLA